MAAITSKLDPLHSTAALSEPLLANSKTLANLCTPSCNRHTVPRSLPDVSRAHCDKTQRVLLTYRD